MSKVEVTIGGHTFEIEVQLSQRTGTEVPVIVDGQAVLVSVPDLDAPIDQMEWLLIDGRPHEVVIDPELRWIRTNTGLHRLELRDLDARVPRPHSRDGRVKSPIPGRIKVVFVKSDDRVEAGQPLLILEAMKMENEIRAPRSGVVNHLNVSVGQNVTLNEVLIEIV
ncbi:MAG TPA: biotin/lipoyl-containing protein [Anaerolineae bacterium]|nr:biotin/lipoyl-containing protein [Anaerolineae bacterium]